MGRHLGLALNLAAIALFVPGILLPIFSLDMNLSAHFSSSTMNTDIVSKELSIMQTVKELWQDDRLLVSALIFAFSVCIPVCKSLLVTFAYFKHETRLGRRIMDFVSAIGKWSMADVFVVAVFLAVLSTNHTDSVSSQKLSVFGFKVNFDVSTETLSNVGAGFYYFTAYCILSLAATQLAQWSIRKKSAEPKQTEKASEAE